MKTSFITTILNEEKTISFLLKSLFKQSEMPDEIIIVDGGSTDNTLSAISNFKFLASRRSGLTYNKKIKFKILKKIGNRAVGRNEAIKKANGNIILCSDAGNILDKHWVENITNPFKNHETDVVAGYCKGKAKTVFQKCLVSYVLVMEDKLDPKSFLPATRSMAFRKSIWKKAGGFPEEFSHNEDYVFANRLKKIGANIEFEKNAIVYWMPRRNLRDAFIMFFRFAYGDSESRIFRPKVLLLFLRYALGNLLLVYFFVSSSYLILNTLYSILILYIIWSILKNYKYVKKIGAFFFLPVLQFISDIAVLLGSISGFASFLNKK